MSSESNGGSKEEREVGRYRATTALGIGRFYCEVLIVVIAGRPLS
jgi:hypothetical protein